MPFQSRNWIHGLWLLLFCLVVGAYLWWGRLDPHHDWWAGATYAAAVALAVSGHWIGRDGARNLGLRWDNLGAALVRFGAVTLLGIVALALIGWGLGHAPRRPPGIGVYLLWAALQQYLLQGFLLQRARSLLDGWGEAKRGPADSAAISASRASTAASGSTWLPALIAGGIFGALHLPNLPLAGATALAGLVWCRLFLATPSLPAAWLSHGAIALVLLAFFKDSPLLNGFEVGRPGYRFEAYGDGIQVAAGRDADGIPFVAALDGPRRGRPARIRVFRIDGTPIAAWDALARCCCGGRIAAGDVAPAPGDEIVVAAGPDPSCGPWVEVYAVGGERLSAFEAKVLPDQYGAHVSVQDKSILLGAGPGPGAAPVWAEYTFAGELRNSGIAPLGTVFCNGIRWTRLPRRSPPASAERIFWGTPISVNPAAFLAIAEAPENPRKLWVYAFPATYGLSLAPIALGEGRSGVAVSLGPLVGYPRWIRIFAMDTGWPLVRQFAVEDARPAAGLNLAAVDLDFDGCDELILGEGEGEGIPPLVRVVRLDGQVLYTWPAGGALD
ncbi:MAG: hypothetical protein Kow00109_24080 [Acidobacteriota bacterium]